MQINNSASSFATNHLGTGASAKSKGDTFRQFMNDGNYASTDNALFKNLLSNPSLQDNYTIGANGKYEFIADAKGIPHSNEVGILRMLIGEQNGNFDWQASGAVGLFTSNELAQFRQMTGYNLVQAGGLITVVDDYGNNVPAQDQARVEAVWQTFDLAKFLANEESPGSEISIGNLQQAAQLMAEAHPGTPDIWEDFFNLIDGLSASEGAETAFQAAQERVLSVP